MVVVAMGIVIVCLVLRSRRKSPGYPALSEPAAVPNPVAVPEYEEIPLPGPQQEDIEMEPNACYQLTKPTSRVA